MPAELCVTKSTGVSMIQLECLKPVKPMSWNQSLVDGQDRMGWRSRYERMLFILDYLPFHLILLIYSLLLLYCVEKKVGQLRYHDACQKAILWGKLLRVVYMLSASVFRLEIHFKRKYLIVKLIYKWNQKQYFAITLNKDHTNLDLL